MDKLTAQKILGVSPQASKREIKKAYAAMLRMYHPEDYPEEFQKIQEAYETLNKGGFPGEGSGNDGFSEGAFSENEGFRKEEEWQEEQEQKEENRGEQSEDDWEDAWESLDKDEEAWKKRQQEEQERRQQQEEQERRQQQEEQERRRQQEELRKRQQEEEYRRARQQKEEYRRKIQEEEYRKAREELDFEKIEWKAREEKKLKEKETIAAALKDLELIVNTSSRRHRLKSYEEFFAKEEYKEVLFMPECVEGVCQILENTWLKREVYDIFAREYHIKPEQLKPGARKLYHILDEHCKFGKKRHKYQIGAGIFVAVLVLLRSLMRATDDNDWFYFLLVLVTAGLYWGYHGLLKYYSRWRIHIIYSLGITVSQFIMLMADAYTPLLGNRDAGEVFGAMVFLGGSLYFIVTVAAYVIARISHKIRRTKEKNK